MLRLRPITDLFHSKQTNKTKYKKLPKETILNPNNLIIT